MPAQLPIDKKLRKKFPIGTGFLDYFPDAVAAVAFVSYTGNAQHNGPDAPLHWARGKSDDHEDTVIRHFIERGGFDVDGTRHTAKACWRMLATLQLEIEAARARGEPGLCAEDVTPPPATPLNPMRDLPLAETGSGTWVDRAGINPKGPPRSTLPRLGKGTM